MNCTITMAVYSEKMVLLSAPSTVYNTQLVQDPKNLSAFNNYVINRMMVH